MKEATDTKKTYDDLVKDILSRYDKGKSGSEEAKTHKEEESPLRFSTKHVSDIEKEIKNDEK